MTPKEKAEQLVDKMYTCYQGHIDKYTAKQCALIAVDEIIDALETYDERTEEYLNNVYPNYLSCELQNMEQDFRYYKQVKKEIEKL